MTLATSCIVLKTCIHGFQGNDVFHLHDLSLLQPMSSSCIDSPMAGGSGGALLQPSGFAKASPDPATAAAAAGGAVVPEASTSSSHAPAAVASSATSAAKAAPEGPQGEGNPGTEQVSELWYFVSCKCLQSRLALGFAVLYPESNSCHSEC